MTNNQNRKLAAILFADMTERFFDEGGKIKDGKSIFDSKGTEAPAEGGIAYNFTIQ